MKHVIAYVSEKEDRPIENHRWK